MANPAGKWVMTPDMNMSFVNEDIGAIYGKVYPRIVDPLSNEIRAGLMWYWEARTGLDTRANGVLPCGWVYTEKEAEDIVERLLYATKTVEPPKKHAWDNI